MTRELSLLAEQVAAAANDERFTDRVTDPRRFDDSLPVRPGMSCVPYERGDE